MARSPFAFLRGAAAVMARDLGQGPRSGLKVQLAGDAHVANFGVFGTPERDLVFDVNDFDETLPGPWEWDVKRLATSLVLAAQEIGSDRLAGHRIAVRAVRTYREAMAAFAARPYLDTWYFHLDRDAVAAWMKRHQEKFVDRTFGGGARRRPDVHAFPRFVQRSAKGLRIRDDPPLIVHYSDAADLETSRAFYDGYRRTLPDERRMLLERYEVADVAQKVVGVGSVGTVCSVVLLTADRDPEDTVFLQVKEAMASALEPYVGASRYASHGERVVVGQHLIQEASDIFLGWSRLGAREFYVRQLRDMKIATDVDALTPKALLQHGALCAAALARAHARTGDPAAISGYLGKADVFDHAVADFAEEYADQTRKDHAALLRAIRQGRVPAKTGV